MKSIMITGLLLSWACFAKLPTATIQDFEGSYEDPSGTAQISKLIYEDFSLPENSTLEVEKQAGALFLRVGDQQLSFTDLPDIIYTTEKMNWSGINLESDLKKISASVDSLSTDSEDNSLKISNLSANCEGDITNSKRSMLESLLETCLNKKGELRLGQLITKDKLENKKSILNSLWLKVDGDKLNFSLHQKVTIKGWGEAFYEGSMIRVRIDKAKAGFLNVTGTVFKELKKLENDMIRVNRPWIEIDLAE